MQVEKAKIDLTANESAAVELAFIDPFLQIIIARHDFGQTIQRGLEKIATTIGQTLVQAGLRPADIQAVFLTGGSTAIPAVQLGILGMFPQSDVIQGDLFGSVGLGLALDARRKFI
jgi:hypothetical chaperone protein